MAVNGRVVVLAAFLIIVSGDHECERVCREGESKNCYYHFTISIGLKKCSENGECHRRTSMVINGLSPGPLISVCENDFITIDVKNALPSGMETAIHWHGLRQRGRPHMDGVPMITQCPIQSGMTFRYSMKADRAGTFYYHAHSVFQQLDGLHGALIIRRGETVNRVVLLAPQLPVLTSIESGMVNDLSVVELKSTSYIVDDGGQPERIGLINAAALDCSLKIVSSDMTILSLDGNEIKARRTLRLTLHPGERADVVTESGFNVIGMGLCAGKNILQKDDVSQHDDDLENDLSADDITLDRESYHVFIPFDENEYTHQDNPDFRYKLSETIHVAPAYLNDFAEAVSVYQFRNISFLYPSSPLLTQPEDVDKGCPNQKSCGTNFCECLNVLSLPFNQTVDLILIDEGRRGKTVQTVHLHGHTFRVIGKGILPNPTTEDEVKSLIDSGKVQYDLVSPVEKDTVPVPHPGFVILRIKTDNPGDWLLESVPSKARSGIGLEMVIHIDGVKSTPKNFPRCGTLKPQDLVIMDD